MAPQARMNQMATHGHEPSKRSARRSPGVAALPGFMPHSIQRPKLFPLEVRHMLQRAAQTPIPRGDPYARMKAVDAAITRARQMHPECFKVEAPSSE
jgi:hypothetical protein